MCGIGGYVDFTGKPSDKDVLVKMSSFLKERGPDATGYWQHKNIGFTHTRLSIVDLSESGNQAHGVGESCYCF